MGRRKKKLRIHAINLVILTYTQQCSGCNSEIGGRGERRGEKKKTNIFYLGCTQLSWWREKDAIYPRTLCRFPFRVYSISRVRGLFEPTSQWQKKKEREKPKPSYNLSARSCHLTTAVFSLYTTDKHFFFFASFLPSKRISKLPLLISFRLVFPPVVQCFLTYVLMALKVI